MKTFAAPLMALILVSGCSRKEPPPAPAAAPVAQAPVAAKPAPAPAVEDRYAALMRAVFGSQYRSDKGDALAPMPDANAPGTRSPLVLSGVQSTQLPSGETVLVVAGEVVDENGNADSSHASPGYLSLYLLRQENGQWSVLRKHENVAELGSHGSVGKLAWVELGPGKTGLAAEHGMTAQGTTVMQLSLFDPAAEKVADLTGNGIVYHYDDEGGCSEMRERCAASDAKWRLDTSSSAQPYFDLVLDIESTERVAKPGAMEAGPKDGADDIERDERTTRTTARYGFIDGKFRLREGSNPMDSE